MQPTEMRTVNVPLSADGSSAVLLASAMPDKPMRVVVQNIGMPTVFVGFSAGEVQTLGSGTFQIFANQSQIFVLAPGQKLSGQANGAGSQVCVATSEAFPVGAF